MKQKSTMFNQPQRILVLYRHSNPQEMRTAIRHHLQALNYCEVKHEVFYYNALCGAPFWLGYLDFDVIILHTTLLCWRWSKLFKLLKWQLKWIGNLDCIKIAIPQDEYDHSDILDQWLFEWGVSVILTNFDEDKQKTIYPKMHNKALFYKCFTGYIDNSTAQKYALKISPLENRPYDIVYRATRLPYWFGSHGQLKHEIAQVIANSAEKFDLKCDISTLPEDTIVGEKWFDFLASGKTVIGCESGSSVLEPHGEIRTKIQSFLHSKPTASFDEISACLPSGWDDYQFFAISPRHFEAIITKTCQVLVEGHYDGVLEANRHYIPLKRDFSNIDEVLKKVKNTKLVNKIAECAYQEIYLSGKYSYHNLAINIEKAILESQQLNHYPRKIVKYIPLSLIRLVVKLSESLYKNFYFLLKLLSKVFYPIYQKIK